MKQIIITIGITAATLIISLTLISKESEMDRNDELNRAVSAAVKQTVSDSQVLGQTEIASNEDMAAHFIQIMSINMNSNSDITVEVMGADYQEGMFDVLVTGKFKYANGKEGEVSVRKCAIYE